MKEDKIYIAIDIETVPNEAELQYFILNPPEFDAPSNYKDPIKIQSVLAEKKQKWEQDLIKRCSLDPDYGQIIAIALHNDKDSAVLTSNATENDEKGLLETLWVILSEIDCLVGFNIYDFDFPYIMRRSLINNIVPSKFFRSKKYDDYPIFDIMKYWTNWSNRPDDLRGKNLDEIGRICGVGRKTAGMSGDKVYDYYQDGRIKEIASYCLDDAILTWNIYNRIRRFL